LVDHEADVEDSDRRGLQDDLRHRIVDASPEASGAYPSPGGSAGDTIRNPKLDGKLGGLTDLEIRIVSILYDPSIQVNIPRAGRI
jgi:hypothetical protein